MKMNDHDREQYLAVRKEAGLKIDPETAEVDWEYGSVRDPYYLFEHGDDWEDNIGRNYFARSPGSDVWVHFDDLPDATLDALEKKRRAAFGPVSHPRRGPVVAGR